jgi:hypothetical protein
MLSKISQYFNFNIPISAEAFLILKIILIILSFSMLSFILWVVFKTSWFKRMYLWDLQEFVSYHPHGVRKLYKQWQKIKIRLETGIETEYKLAVIEADSMLEDILKGMGFVGETLAERLDKLTDATLPNLAEVLETHRIRNSIVHDPDYRLTLDDAKTALEVYEKALSDLQAL